MYAGPALTEHLQKVRQSQYLLRKLVLFLVGSPHKFQYCQFLSKIFKLETKINNKIGRWGTWWGWRGDKQFKNPVYNMQGMWISMLILSWISFAGTQHQPMQMQCNYSCSLQRPQVSVSGRKPTEQVAVIFLTWHVPFCWGFFFNWKFPWYGKNVLIRHQSST